MAKKQKKQREKDIKDSVMWSQRHTTAVTEQAKLFEKFKDFFDVMYATRSYKNTAPWRSKIYIPILAGKAWDFIAKLADVEPRFVASIRDEWQVGEDGKPYFPEEVNARAEKISHKLAFDYKNPMQLQSPRDRVFSTLVDTVVTGTGIAKISRNVQDKEYKAHEAIGDNGDVNTDEEIIQKVTEGSNTFEPVSIFNVFVAPATDELQSAPWIIIDGFSTLDELYEADIYENDKLDKIDVDWQASSDEMAQYSVSRNRLVLSEDRVSADKSVKLLKTHECYYRNSDGRVCIETYVEAGGTVGDEGGWLKIRDLEDPYWHNRYPLQTFYIRRKPYSFWGESLFENNETLQYASNDVFNHYMDNLNLALDGMVMMDENAYIEDFVVAPGELLLYKNEQPKQFRFPEPNPGQLSMVMNTMNEGIENATVSSYASGTPNADNDKTQGTATGISKIMEAAQDKLGFMRSNFKSSMEGVGFMWLLNDQQFMDKAVTIPMNTPDGIVPSVITPLDLQGIVDITIDDDSMTPVSKSGEREMKKAYVQELLSLQTASINQANLLQTPEDVIRLDFRNLVRDTSDAYGQKTYSQFILPTPEPQPQPPVEDKPSVSVNYKDTPEDVKRQLEEKIGVQPSEGISPQGIKESQAQIKSENDVAMNMATMTAPKPNMGAK